MPSPKQHLQMPPQGLSTYQVISCVAFLVSLLTLSLAFLNFWNFLLLNPLVKTGPLGRTHTPNPISAITAIHT